MDAPLEYRKQKNVIFDAFVFDIEINSVCWYTEVINNPKFIICQVVKSKDVDCKFSNCKFCKNHPFCSTQYVKTVMFYQQVLKDQEDLLDNYYSKDCDDTINIIFFYIKKWSVDFQKWNNKE